MEIPEIKSKLPELRRLRRQAGFFKKLDRSLQSARMCFAHEDESEVFEERLEQKSGSNPVRTELKMLSHAYESWIESLQGWDPPLILRKACAALRDPGLDLSQSKFTQFPEEMFCLVAETSESLEKEFFELLGQKIPLRFLGPLAGEHSGAKSEIRRVWQRWHTVDDAVEALVDELRSQWESAGTLSDEVILIPDLPAVRRSVTRALKQAGIPLRDTRDPTRLILAEDLKWALLPLEVVARGYERERVIAFLRVFLNHPEHPAWVAEIQARGIRQGLTSYQSGLLAQAHSFLSELEEALGGRRSCGELGERHLRYLRASAGEDSSKSWLLAWIESAWKSFVADLESLGQSHRRAPALYWFERLKERIADASPPPERVHAEGGVTLHRLGQAPLEPCSRVWIVGMTADFLSSGRGGDYWFSEKDREVLSSEFSVRSGIQIAQDRLRSLWAWTHSADSLYVLDAAYSWDGAEREAIFPILEELGFEIDSKPEEKGAHSRWVASFNAFRPLQPTQIKLSPAKEREIKATTLDLYSSCGFKGLAGGRWRLRDHRDPGGTPWPDASGRILHRAIHLLMQSRSAEGAFGISIEQALDNAIREERPKGMLKGKRLESYAKAKWLQILAQFCEKEREYVQRAKTQVASMEGPVLRMEFGDFSVMGIPDRIDEHPDGLFVLDYKMSSQLPKGAEMFDQGYRLQLPFYAIAAQKEFKKPALGIQFVELNKKGNRSSGIFPKAYNGKTEGKLTATTANSKSLIAMEPGEIWDRAQAQIESHARAYLKGRFEALPKKEGDCDGCDFSDLCGLRRRTADGEVSSNE